MRRAVWMNLHDIEGREPAQVLDFLQGHGLNGCNLGVRYHGGRMLLPAHPKRVVLSHKQFEASGEELSAFTEAARRRGFDVRAWTVLTHNDGDTPSDWHVQNAFGERYPYALCPANPAVRNMCVEACERASQVGALDLEAASFMGYEHAGLHDKRGIPLSPQAALLLSVCCCSHCGTNSQAEIAKQLRDYLSEPYSYTVAFDASPILEHRRRTQVALLQAIRSVLPHITINVRVAPDPMFSGGKCSLAPSDVIGLADEVTYTFFGAAAEKIALPHERPLPAHAGIVFHEPDCCSEANLRTRLERVLAARPDGLGFYSFSMAAPPHWRWLRAALQEIT